MTATQPQIFRRVVGMEDEEIFMNHDRQTYPQSRAENQIMVNQTAHSRDESGIKPKSVTNLYVANLGGRRNQSTHFNSGALRQNLSKKHSNEKSGSIGVGTQADLLTNVESSHQALIR